MRRPADRKDFVRSLHLGQELDVAVGLLEQGLAAVQGDIGTAGSMTHLQLVLLSTGLERLLKCIVSYHIRETQGRFPRGGEIRKTHDVESLLDEVLDKVFTGDYVTRPSVRADYEFLKRDPRWRALLSALRQFAEPLGRYWNLNVAMGAGPSRSPQDVWHDVEMQVMDDEGLGEVLAGLDEDDSAGINAVFEQAANAIVAILERGLRALCSLFEGALGYLGTTVGANVQDFVVIRDEDLGSRGYAQHRRRPP